MPSPSKSKPVKPAQYPQTNLKIKRIANKWIGNSYYIIGMYCCSLFYYLINKAEKNVAICFSLLIFANVYIFDVVGIKASVWFLTQAYFDLLFVVAALLIRNKYIMYAAIIICSHSFMINIIEHLSEKQSVFYSLWGIYKSTDN